MKLQTQANLEKLYKISLRKSTHSTQFELYKYEKPKPFWVKTLKSFGSKYDRLGNML